MDNYINGSGHSSAPNYGADDWDSSENENIRDIPPEAIGQDERRMQVRAYNHWASLLGDRAFPYIEDLEPEKLPEFAPVSVVLDFSEGVEDPYVQYIGSQLARECGVTGGVERLSDVPSRSLLTRITDHYMQILSNQAPIGFEAEFVNSGGEPILYRGILLPFSSDDETIDCIYGVINWKEIADQVTADELLLEIDQAIDQTAEGNVEMSQPIDENFSPLAKKSPAHSPIAPSSPIKAMMEEEALELGSESEVSGHEDEDFEDESDGAINRLADLKTSADNIDDRLAALAEYTDFSSDEFDDEDEEEATINQSSFASLTGRAGNPNKRAINLSAFGQAEDPEPQIAAVADFEDFPEAAQEELEQPHNFSIDSEPEGEAPQLQAPSPLAVRKPKIAEPSESAPPSPEESFAKLASFVTPEEAQEPEAEPASQDESVAEKPDEAAARDHVDVNRVVHLPGPEDVFADEADENSENAEDEEDTSAEVGFASLDALSAKKFDKPKANLLDPVGVPEIASTHEAHDAQDVVIEEVVFQSAAVSSHQEPEPEVAEAPQQERNFDVLDEHIRSARELAQAAAEAEARSRDAVFEALGKAYDVSIAADEADAEFSAMIEKQGLTKQDAAAMAPIIEMIFGAEVDRGNAHDYAKVLGYAHKVGVERGGLAAYLRQHDGGIASIVGEEQVMPEQQLADNMRNLDMMVQAAIDPDGPQFGMVMVRRCKEGSIEILGEVEVGTAILEKAANKLAG